MNGPKITIVVATWNAEATLERCLDSVRAQTYRNVEIVVADGVSKDRTLEILERRRSELAVLVSEKDRGIYDAWNKVVPKATGEWLLFLGADDELDSPTVLEKAAAVLAEARENVVYGKVAIMLPDGTILNHEGAPWEESADKFKHEMTIPHQGVFHRRSLFEKHGLFDPSFRICGDYEFLLRELKSHPARFIPDLVVSKMAFGGVSSTLANVTRIIDELERARRMNGLGGLSPYILGRRIRVRARSGLERVFGRGFADGVADLYRKLTGKPALWKRLDR
jgi:glycosyltransferase involved in cell wall biosynthesis